MTVQRSPHEPQARVQNLPPHYIVTLEGQVWEKSTMTNTKVAKSFTVTIPVPIKVHTSVPTKVTTVEDGTLWVDEYREVHIDEIGIRAYLRRTKRLLEFLKRRKNADGTLAFPNIHSMRTVQVLNVAASDPSIALPSDPLNLNLTQLKHWIRMNHAPIDTTFFATLAQLREAVINYKEDPVSYKTYEQVMKKKHGKHAAFTAVSEQLENAYENYTTEEIENATNPSTDNDL